MVTSAAVRAAILVGALWALQTDSLAVESIAAFALPSRTQPAERLQARVNHVAEAMARRLHSQPVAGARQLDLSALQHGKKLFFSGAVGQAATVLDGAID